MGEWAVGSTLLWLNQRVCRSDSVCVCAQWILLHNTLTHTHILFFPALAPVDKHHTLCNECVLWCSLQEDSPPPPPPPLFLEHFWYTLGAHSSLFLKHTASLAPATTTTTTTAQHCVKPSVFMAPSFQLPALSCLAFPLEVPQQHNAAPRVPLQPLFLLFPFPFSYISVTRLISLLTDTHTKTHSPRLSQRECVSELSWNDSRNVERRRWRRQPLDN